MVDSNQIKSLARDFGADLCGMASVDRFQAAPEGFRPTDIYPDCQSVIVFAKRLPTTALFMPNCVPYTHVNQMGVQEVDRLGFLLALKLEDMGLKAVPIPSDDPYEHWEPERSYGRAILSLRHAGYLAGLGQLGKNTLLMNNQYGNMIQIGAILTDIALEIDPLATYDSCLAQCRRCLDACPQGALDGVTVNQQLCRPLSAVRTEKGYILKKCSRCRSACPHCLGIPAAV
jgi:epoxyqueuosine reductase